MGAPEGNQFWKLRSKHGRDRLFTSPDDLWEAAQEYFEATDKRKWVKKDWVGKDADEVYRETDTPYSISGFCVYIDASRNYWNETKKTASKDILGIMARIEQIMFTQKFEGAAVGAFNANIIARDLGLRDNTDVTTDGEKVQMPTIQLNYKGSNVNLGE